MASVLSLLFIVFISSILSYSFFNKDLFSPTVMICISFMISIVLLFFNVERWSINLGIETIGCILVVIITSFVVEGYVKKLALRKINLVNKSEKKFLKINGYMYIVLLGFSILEIALFWNEVVRISELARNMGYNGDILFNYRQITAHSTNLSAAEMMSPIIVQGSKIVMAFSYISIYIFINNVFVNRGRIKDNIRYIIPFILYFVLTIMNASRITLISFFVSCIVMFYILLNKRDRWKVNYSVKFIKIGIISFIIVIVGFVSLSYTVGRHTNNTFFETVSVYLGAPILLFDLYLKSPKISNMYFGQETFVNLYKSLHKLNIIDSYPSFQTEFRYINGYNLGNVYTGMRRPIQDFGYIGLILVIAIFVGIYSYIYYKKIRGSKARPGKEIDVFIYSYFYYSLTLFAIDFIPYSFFTFGNIITIIIMVIFYKYLVVYDIKKKKARKVYKINLKSFGRRI